MDRCEFDYELREIPTRITPWPGNVKVPFPSSANFKDPYGPTPVKYLTEEDRRYLIRTGALEGKVHSVRAVHNRKKLKATFPDGRVETYNSAEEFARHNGHSSCYVRRFAKFGEVLRSTGVRVEYMEGIVDGKGN